MLQHKTPGENGTARLVSRNGNTLKSFAGLCDWLCGQVRVRDAILDGEIVSGSRRRYLGADAGTRRTCSSWSPCWILNPLMLPSVSVPWNMFIVLAAYLLRYGGRPEA